MRLLKVSQVSSILSISKSKIYDLAREGKIPAVIIGSCVRIPENKLIEWIEQNTSVLKTTSKYQQAPVNKGNF